MIKLIRFLLGINPPCIHDWQVLTKESPPSRIEIMHQNTAGLNCPVFAIDINEMSEKKTFIILSCKKCGKLNKDVITN